MSVIAFFMFKALISLSILLPNSKFLFPKKYGICFINIIKPDRLRDWISTPKANGYESLHTTRLHTSSHQQIQEKINMAKKTK